MTIYIVEGFTKDARWSLYAFSSKERATDLLMHCRDAILIANHQRDLMELSPDKWGAKNVPYRSLHYRIVEVELITDEFTKFAVKGLK